VCRRDPPPKRQYDCSSPAYLKQQARCSRELAGWRRQRLSNLWRNATGRRGRAPGEHDSKVSIYALLLPRGAVIARLPFSWFCILSRALDEGGPTRACRDARRPRRLVFRGGLVGRKHERRQRDRQQHTTTVADLKERDVDGSRSRNVLQLHGVFLPALEAVPNDWWIHGRTGVKRSSGV
jgi:hypothetical protein